MICRLAAIFILHISYHRHLFLYNYVDVKHIRYVIWVEGGKTSDVRSCSWAMPSGVIVAPACGGAQVPPGRIAGKPVGAAVPGGRPPGGGTPPGGEMAPGGGMAPGTARAPPGALATILGRGDLRASPSGGGATGTGGTCGAPPGGRRGAGMRCSSPVPWKPIEF